MEGKNWYALYTKPRNENKVHLELVYAGFEAYLPMVTRLKQWSDRKKKAIEPLFRSYIFVFIEYKDIFNVLMLPGAVRFVMFENKPASIPPQQIDAIRYYLNEKEYHDDEGIPFSEGQLVRVKHGQMEGLIGRMIRHQGKFKLVIRIEAVGSSITLTIPRTLVEPMAE